MKLEPETIKNVYEKYNIVLDPHTAVGYDLSRLFRFNKGHTVVSLATAHPAKFSKALGVNWKRTNVTF